MMLLPRKAQHVRAACGALTSHIQGPPGYQMTSSYEVCKKFGVASAIFSEEAGGVIQGVLVNKSPSPPVEE